MADKYDYHLQDGGLLTLEGDTQPSDDEVESIAKERGLKLVHNDSHVSNTKVNNDKPNIISDLWNKATRPTVDLIPRSVSEHLDEPNTTDTVNQGRLKGFVRGSAEGLSDLVSSFSSPLNIATAGMGGLEELTGSKLAQLGTKILSAPVVAHGAHDLLSSDSTLGQRFSGGVELVGGLLGLRSRTPEIAQRAMSNQPSMPRSNNIDINPNEAALSEDTLGKQIAAHRATELDKVRGSESDIPNNDVARQLELERTGNKPKSITYQNGKEGGITVTPSENGLYWVVRNDTGVGQTLREQDVAFIKDTDRMISNRNAIDVPFKSETVNSQPLSVDEVNKLFTNTKPIEDGTTVSFNNAKQLANNRKLGVQPNEPIIINDPKELNTDQIRKVYMKENPSDTSSPNILMQAPDVIKVKEANSYGYKSAGYIQDGSLKLERKGTYPKTVNPATKESLAQSIYDLPRGLMSVDPPFITSAAFRQAGPLIGTKQWFKSWIPAAKAFGSELTSKNIEDSIQSHPLVKDTLDASGNIKPGYAKRIGVKFTSLNEGLNNREEAIRNDLAEKIPGYGRYVRASNRAYTTYLNTLKLGTLEDIVNGATADQSIGSKLNPFSLQSFGNSDPLNNAVLGKQIGDFINNATGRGSLGPLEDHVKLLSNVLFSPRGIAAKVQMFNPMNYAATEPLVRQQYIKAAARQAGAWWAMSALSTLAGATVSRDPNSADFGKIKIGNTRIDPPGGLQQFLVLGNRMLPESMGGGGITSTTTDRFKSFGSGFKPNTRMSTLGQFGINRLHPTLKLAYDFLDANSNKPFHVGDQIISHIAPLFAGDLMNVAKDNPGLLPIILPLAGAGMGTQSYEKSSFGKPTFLPENMDINIGAK